MKQELKLPKGIKRVTVVRTAPEGFVQPVVVYCPEAKTKKQSKQLRVLEKWMRRRALATRTFGETYAERHAESNQRKRDGWLRDLGYNMLKANRKANKKLTFMKLFGW